MRKLRRRTIEELANSLQVCLDSGAKKVLLPITSAADLGTVPPELIGCFNLIFYNNAEDAVFKALGANKGGIERGDTWKEYTALSDGRRCQRED